MKNGSSPAAPDHCQLPSGWSVQEVAVGDRQFLLRGPAQPDELLDQITAGAGNDVSPYWGAVWPSAIELARLLLQVRRPAGCRCIELGCGLGLVGIAGMAAGLRVVLTDVDPTAVAVADENARRNGFTPISAKTLDWRDPPDGEFEFAIGSDLLYDRSLHQPLLETLERVLAPSGECWLGDPGRSTAKEFVAAARSSGLRVEIDDGQGNRWDSPRQNEFQRLRLVRTVV